MVGEPSGCFNLLPHFFPCAIITAYYSPDIMFTKSLLKGKHGRSDVVKQMCTWKQIRFQPLKGKHGRSDPSLEIPHT